MNTSLKITKIGFPSIMLDNDIQYLNYLFKLIEVVDNNSELTITKTNEIYCISLLPSSTKLRDELIQEIKEAHFLLGIEIEFSKSLKISTYITWYLK